MAVLRLLLILAALLSPSAAFAEAKPPVLVGLTAEFGLQNSTSAQAVERGIRMAIAEINASGGVLGGRKLDLVVRDDRSVPARGIDNLREMATLPDLVAVFGARFSPVMIEISPEAHKLGMILMVPWSSADSITDHDTRPNYAFRLSLKDSLAMPAILGHAAGRGFRKVAIFYPNTAWGRSNQRAAEHHLAAERSVRMVLSRTYNWGDPSLVEPYLEALNAGAEALVLVANDREAGLLVREMAQLPADKRLPVLSHWGVTGGRFFETNRDALAKVDFSVIQTFSFLTANPKVLPRFAATAKEMYGIDRLETIEAPVGVGHAYDLTHLLGLAIGKAGSTDRAAIRDALEQLGPFEGLTGSFRQPFSARSHDALGRDSLFMARYREDGVLVPLP